MPRLGARNPASRGSTMPARGTSGILTLRLGREVFDSLSEIRAKLKGPIRREIFVQVEARRNIPAFAASLSRRDALAVFGGTSSKER